MDKQAHKKLTWITERLADGMTVYLSTPLKHTKITPKLAQQFADDGHALFKIDGTGSLLIASGKHYDCIDYSALRAIAS